MANEKVTAETYVVLVPDTYEWGGQTRVRGIRVDRVRQSKPSLKSGEIVVKLRLNFDKESLINAIPVVDLDVSAFGTGPSSPTPESAQVLGV